MLLFIIIIVAWISWLQKRTEKCNEKRRRATERSLAEAWSFLEIKDESELELEIVNPEYVNSPKKKCPADLLKLKL